MYRELLRCQLSWRTPQRTHETNTKLQMAASASSSFDEDWEEWSPEKGSFVHHMIAGSVAGLTEHVTIFPIDTVKTHMQCARCPVNGNPLSVSAWGTARKLVEEHGPGRLFRGVSTMLSACIPAHALYFSVFEASKHAFGANVRDPTPLASGAAGVCATVCHDLVMTPMDVIKQRLQLGYYRGVTDCLRAILQQEGFRALYLSFPTTLFMNLPYGMIMVSANETFKKKLNPSGEINIGVYMTSGVAAGALAGALTNPLDVIKTRLQTQQLVVKQAPACLPSAGCAQLQTRVVPLTVTSASPPTVTSSCPVPKALVAGTAEPKLQVQYRGLVDTMGKIYAQEGVRGFFRGMVPRIFVYAPSVAVSWTTFEVLKKTMERFGDSHPESQYSSQYE